MTDDDIVRDIETAARELRALGPVAVRVLAPPEVLLHMRSQLFMMPPPAARVASFGSGLEIVQSEEELPPWTCRVEYSDGTNSLLKLSWRFHSR